MMIPTCKDCGNSFTLIVMIENEVWEKICPEDGVLCIECIEKRIKESGLKGVKASLSYYSEFINAVDNKTLSFAYEADIHNTLRAKWHQHIAHCGAK